ncbi:MAG: hydrogenase iron-sulfur subunit [Pseudomonadota bacterium]
MNTNAKTGIFLCRCGNEIAPLVDLDYLRDTIRGNADYCEILPYPCLKPGMETIQSAVAEHQLNRVIVAGCEGRIMLKKFETALEPLDILRGQISMVNLHSHVASVSDMSPWEKAVKGAKLIKSSIAEMEALKPTPQEKISFNGPVAVVGGGIASFPAVQQLSLAGTDCNLFVETADPDQIINNLHLTYPGERPHYKRLKKIIMDVLENDHVTIYEQCRLKEIAGVTGDYTLTMNYPDGQAQTVNAGAVIAALDAQLDAPGPEFGYDGQRVLIQPEMETYISENGLQKGDVVFWISDYEYDIADQAMLSAKTAWSMAQHIKDLSRKTRVVILYNQQMQVPLSGAERGLSRRLGIVWIPYDKAVRPTVQDGYLTFCNLKDHVEHEIPWDFLVLSPIRGIGGKAKRTAHILGLIHQEAPFLTGHHAKVRPEMLGREETYLIGSARYPCDLQEALSQGKKAGIKNVEMVKKAMASELWAPRMVCFVDPEKCVGCGQCQEICDCGGIGMINSPSGGLPRVVDPMLCTGGGTCAAACPYNALILQNNSTAQKEERIAALSRELAGDEVVSLACVWGGLPAADNAHRQKLTYDPRVHILDVACVGQIDASVMARAFLEGAPGLLLIGCPPEECHHSYGVDHAWNRVNLIKKVFSLCGFDRRRIALAHADLNHPEDFVKTVDSFTALIASLGPIEKTQANKDKLESMYQLCKNNARIRTLVSVALRRPWEKTYLGNQRHALEFDRDFTKAVEDEFEYPKSAIFENIKPEGVLYA